MSYFTFDQNNTGGRYAPDMPHYVIVKADNADEANIIAQRHGVYFDDNYDTDCPCCGTRWYRVTDADATLVPMIYGSLATRTNKDYLIIG